MNHIQILWSGLAMQTLERCSISSSATEARIESVIIGQDKGKICRVDYSITVNHEWQVVSAEINSLYNAHNDHYKLERDKSGAWVLDGEKRPEWKDCIEIDISMTPFTNTLAIKKLQMGTHETSDISVIYFDIEKRQVKQVRQKYSKLSPHVYKFETVPNDFEADIRVDDAGLVTDYLSLFTRASIEHHKY